MRKLGRRKRGGRDGLLLLREKGRWARESWYRKVIVRVAAADRTIKPSILSPFQVSVLSSVLLHPKL
jgi:hypothetical protein